MSQSEEDSGDQGEEGLRRAEQLQSATRPFALA
jgi:hypothetical protein